MVLRKYVKGLGVSGSALSLVLMYAGCAEKRPYDALLKDGVHEKSLISTTEDYLYVPSMGDSPRTNTATRPHWMGDAKRVRLSFTEKELKVVELEADARFQQNTMNERPVLSIPVDHLEYRCAENSNGECTNKEEENNTITWDKKSNFKPRIADISIEEVNFLPLEIENLFFNCYTLKGTQVAGYEITESTLNIAVDKTYEANIRCASDIESLSELTFKVRNHYSLVKLSQLASANYEAVTYPNLDQGTFGFFTTESHTLSVDNRDEVTGQKVLLNRWNPKKKEVVYTLSASFAKPENAGLLAATKKAIEATNAGLQEARAGIQIVLNGPADLPSGDLRNNMIVLVDDPQDGGLIGYGPSITNPLTGEIVHARTVMYGGTLKKYLKNAYDEMVAQKRIQDANGSGGVTSRLAIDSNASAVLARLELGKDQDLASLARIAKNAVKSQMHPHTHSSSIQSDGINSKGILTTKIEAQIKDQLFGRQKETLSASRVKDQIELMSEKCVYTADQVNFADAVSQASGRIALVGNLKPWDSLSDGEKQQVIDVLLPYVWIPVLIHEVGHNLGLRHNFAGSEDKINFFKKDEALTRGMDVVPQFSSVMDYAYRSLDELTTLGKYDIAALRFGYAREVAIVDAKAQAQLTPESSIAMEYVPVVSTLGETSKALGLSSDTKTLYDYRFCTDEHVGPNPGCKRFDEGTNLVEIAQHLVQSYEDNYKKRNFRNGQRHFSSYDEKLYRARIRNALGNLRTFFDVYESLKVRYAGISEDRLLANKFIKELHDAVVIAGNQLVKIVETPDVHCALGEAGGSGIATVMPLSVLSGYTGVKQMSCFSADVKDLADANGLTVIAQAGKHFEDTKDPLSENSYVDQIDVRGVKVDKEVALEMLLMRRTVSPTDRLDTQVNFLNQKVVGPRVQRMLKDVLHDSLSGPVEFELESGDVGTLELGWSLERDQVHLSKIVLTAITTHAHSEKRPLEARALLSAFEVYKEIVPGLTDVETLSIGNMLFHAVNHNTLAKEVMARIKLARTLSVLSEESLAKVVQAILQAAIEGRPVAIDANATEAEKAALKLSLDQIELFSSGQIKSENYYLRLLNSLAKAH